MWLRLSNLIFYFIVVMVEYVNLVLLDNIEYINLILPMEAIRQVAIILEYIQPCIVWLYKATLKYDVMINLLDIV